jgi:hypothetical protein
MHLPSWSPSLQRQLSRGPSARPTASRAARRGGVDEREIHAAARGRNWAFIDQSPLRCSRVGPEQVIQTLFYRLIGGSGSSHKARIFRLVIIRTRIVIAGENILTPPPLLPCETNDAISGPWLESAPAVTLSSWTSVRRTASRPFAVSTKDNGAAALTQQRS